jgi:hypothetical protein
VAEFEVVGKSENDYGEEVEKRLELQIVNMAKPVISRGNRMKAGSDLLKRMRKGK